MTVLHYYNENPSVFQVSALVLSSIYDAPSVAFRVQLDCLSSEVRLNVDMDTLLTVLANGRYRWLASKLHGFDQSKPKALYRKFIETSGAIEVTSDRRIVVYFDRRSHNPILREAGLDKRMRKIPWLANHRLEFVFS